MESQETIILSWINENIEQLSGEMTNFYWPTKFNLNFYDYQFSLSLNGVEHVGRGCDKNENLALIKAVSEAVERYCCYQNNIGSNGIACHSDHDNCSESATNELIERDCFLCFFLTNTPFVNKPLSLPTEFDIYQKYIASKNLEINLYDISCYRSLHTVIAIAKEKEQKNLGIIIGLGTSASIKAAKYKALTEVVRNLESYINGNFNNLSPKEIENDIVLYHMYYALDPNNFSIYNFFLKPNNFFPQKTDLPLLISNEIFFNNSLLDQSPFICYQTSSIEVQNIFWSHPSVEKINLERLSKFKNEKVKFEDINTDIHPLG